MPPYLFILPNDWKDETLFNRETVVRFKLFKMCVCGTNDLEKHSWTSHSLNEPRPYITRSHQFIDLLAPTLLLGARIFFSGLRMSQDPGGSTSMSLTASPFPDPREVFEHIQKELGLFDVGAVKAPLQYMIFYLEEVHLPRQDAADFLQFTSKPPPSSGLSYPLRTWRYSLIMSISAHLTLRVPTSTSTRTEMISGFRMNHVKRTIERFDYCHVATGKFDVRLRTPKDLAVLCRIDPTEASCITELKKGTGPSSSSSGFLAATQADIALVRDIIRSSRNQLTAAHHQLGLGLGCSDIFSG
ncbi:MAG: hypothetical protein J3R72DRAFT_492102 [Linnemannia gamsii]|nr:MAG: hypothetical protein J3R72DRAFT_492102 [Linnemannia gamsii]